jgi:hypothetical protein
VSGRHVHAHLTTTLNISAKSRLFLAVAVGAISVSPTALAATTTTTTPGKDKTVAKQTTSKKTTTAAKSTAPMGATGKTCYNALIQDWYDGRIDKTYPVHCYQDALKHLPQDVQTYSDAYDVISRALADATRGKPKIDPNAPVAPPDSGAGTTTTTKTGTGGTTTLGGSGQGPIGTGLGSGDRGATGVPVPLLILGGLALLLVAAGAIGFIVRRYQSRGGPNPS